MITPSEFVALNPDGTAVLGDGRLVRLVAGRSNMLGYREVDANARTEGEQAAGAVDQLGGRAVPTMREALG